MRERILLIDDEEAIRFSLRGILEDEGFTVFDAQNGERGLALLSKETIDLVFLDIWMPGLDGLEVLERICHIQPSLPVIMISGHGTIETAVTAIRKGALDFIEKPLSLEKVLLAAERTLEVSALKRENQALRSRVQSDTQEITGNSPSILALKKQLAQVAPTEAWVLITGENGTGKEIAAHSLHQQSRRKNKPFVAVNCAAIPEELIESELFGHEKGAFTGADAQKIGRFEMAHQGTLFLDEIGDMSLKTQAKILRILQEQHFERVGGSQTVRVDVRVVAATNKNLEEAIKQGTFREDLYYRLRVFPLSIPPLRERVADLPLLMDEFLHSLTAEHSLSGCTFPKKTLQVLQQYPWPGNVRELRNLLERLLILYGGQEITVDMLPPEYRTGAQAQVSAEQIGSEAEKEYDVLRMPLKTDDFKTARSVFEAHFLAAKLQEYEGNVSRLAEAIGLERSYLHRKLKAYNIQSE